MNKPSTQWTDSIHQSVKTALTQASTIPKGETLEVDKLNEILNMLDQFKATFLTQCSIQGLFTTRDNNIHNNYIPMDNEYCQCWLCLNTGPNGECVKCGKPPSPERLAGEEPKKDN